LDVNDRHALRELQRKAFRRESAQKLVWDAAEIVEGLVIVFYRCSRQGRTLELAAILIAFGPVYRKIFPAVSRLQPLEGIPVLRVHACFFSAV